MITPDGFLLTSAHVVARTDSRGRASFADGRDISFEVVGADPLSDLECAFTDHFSRPKIPAIARLNRGARI